MKLNKIEEIIVIPEKVEAKIEGGVVNITGPKGENKRNLFNPKIKIELEGKNIKLSAKKPTKREKTMIGTFKAHVKNMIKGVLEGYVYTLKICASHFPITTTVEKEEFIVKNFLGEKIPRKLKLRPGITVKVEGEVVTVESIDKELAGQTAADIEKLTKRVGFDKRIFQDGIYLTNKGGKEI